MPPNTAIKLNNCLCRHLDRHSIQLRWTRELDSLMYLKQRIL